MKRTAFLTGTALFVAALGAGGYWYWTGTPQHSLGELWQGFKDRDRPAVEAHLDVSAVARSVVDETVARLSDGGPTGGRSNLAGFGSALASRFADNVRPMLEANTRDAITEGITSPDQSPAGRALSRVTSDDLIVVSRHDTMTLVRLMIPGDGGGAGTDSLTMRLTQRGRKWVVVEVEGVRRWLDALAGNERQARRGSSPRPDSREAPTFDDESDSDDPTRIKALLKSDLKTLAGVQESFYADHSRYARSIAEVTPEPYGWRPTPGVQIELEGDGHNWQARATWGSGEIVCRTSSFAAEDDGEWEGESARPVPTCG
ncbi:MAG: hypothetical protein M3N43_01565 [Actinomycetota bacterium]|nr:hypothetical protein [Actinomycetota bacterium]